MNLILSFQKRLFDHISVNLQVFQEYGSRTMNLSCKCTQTWRIYDHSWRVDRNVLTVVSWQWCPAWQCVVSRDVTSRSIYRVCQPNTITNRLPTVMPAYFRVVLATNPSQQRLQNYLMHISEDTLRSAGVSGIGCPRDYLWWLHTYSDVMHAFGYRRRCH
jgi:hypothetical protein